MALELKLFVLRYYTEAKDEARDYLTLKNNLGTYMELFSSVATSDLVTEDKTGHIYKNKIIQDRPRHNVRCFVNFKVGLSLLELKLYQLFPRKVEALIAMYFYFPFRLIIDTIAN